MGQEEHVKGFATVSGLVLTISSFGDGQYLKRSGNVLCGDTPAGGGTPAVSVIAETSFGASVAVGTTLLYAREDHTHGSPTDPVPAHVTAYNHTLLHSNALDHSNTLDHAEVHGNAAHSVSYATVSALSIHTAAASPHTGHEITSNKGIASGYASLGVTTLVPTAQLATGTANSAVFLCGNQSWATPPSSGGGPTTILVTADAQNSTTTLANCTGLIFALASNKSYGFNFYIRFTTPLNTCGIGLTLNGPATNYVVFDAYIPISSIAAKTFTYTIYSAFVLTTTIGAANSSVLAMIDGVIAPTAAGNLIVRYATAIASQIAKIKAGSFGVLYALN